MGYSLSIDIKELSTNISDNTSNVDVYFYCTTSGETWDGGGRSGDITVNGSKYTFTSKTALNTKNLIWSKNFNISHNSDGTGSVSASGGYDVSNYYGYKTTSNSLTLTKINRYWTVSYDANGGTGAPSSQTKNYGSTLTLSSVVPTRTGYTFTGWSDGSTTYQPGGAYTKNAAATLKAQWQEKSATLTYNINGGIGTIPSVTMLYTQSYTATSIGSVTRPGYTFRYWSTKADGSGTKYDPGQSIKAANVIPSNITLYAYWTPNNVDFIFVNKDGTEQTRKTVPYDSIFYFSTVPPTKQEVDSDFKGWQSSATQTIYSLNSSVKVTSITDVVFTAVWVHKTKHINLYGITSSNPKDYYTKENFKLIQEIEYPINTEMDMSRYSTIDLDNYKFSGYWMIDEPFRDKDNKLYVEGYEPPETYPTGILPYNYNTSTYEGTTPIYSNPLVLNLIEGEFFFEDYDINIYAVYRDNTLTQISFVSSGYNYVVSDGGVDKLQFNEYFDYIENRKISPDLKFTESSDKIYGYYKFLTLNNKINISKLIYIIMKNTEGNPYLSDYIVKEVRTANSSDTTYYYILFTNIRAIDGYESYSISLSGLTDTLSKNIYSEAITIIPPKVIFNVNSKGSIFTFFDKSVDYIEGITDDAVVNPARWFTTDLSIIDDEHKEKYQEAIIANSYIDINKLLKILVSNS